MKENKYKLVEETGFSYSGVSDMIRNKNKTEELLLELDDFYNEAKDQQSKLEKQLELIKQKRGMAVSMFINCHKILCGSDKPLVFNNDGNTIIVNIKDENTIDYNEYEITKIK